MSQHVTLLVKPTCGNEVYQKQLIINHRFIMSQHVALLVKPTCDNEVYQ